MQKVVIPLIAVLCLPLSLAARSHEIPTTLNFRYSAQVSNAPPGACGCFGLQGAAADLSWNLMRFGGNHAVGLELLADVGSGHTSSVNGAPYGLTLTTVSAGPRFSMPSHRLQLFAQALFGLAHGSGSEFPQSGTLVSSANSLAWDSGVGIDYSIDKRFAVRVLQVDYLRTSLPNSGANRQNNLRIGAGITLRFPR